MRQTTKTESTAAALTVDTKGLQSILNCGRPTAVEIGTKAGARIQVGGKRVLWNVHKISNYLDSIAM